MSRWAWIFPLILIAAVAVSLLRRAPETTGERLLAAMNARHLPTREALLLLDYSPDADLLAAARTEPVMRGLGEATGLGVTPQVIADQHWIRVKDATLYWPSGPELRPHLDEAAKTLHEVTDDAPLAAALAQLQNLPDEQLFLAWLHADRGVLAELNDPIDAARQALLLETLQNPGPALAFPVGDGHVYLLPDDRTADATWCRLFAFDAHGAQVWSATLRLDGTPPPEHVRTLAVLLAEESLRLPATTPTIPTPLHF